MTRCKNVSDIVKEADRILFHDLDCLQDKDAEFYFRGESLKFARKNEGTALPLGTSFPCFLDREEEWWTNERELYQEALRLNVVSFEEDKTMVERLARMQHYQMPTRFCDMTSNVFRQEGFAEHLCDIGVADLYAGDFTFFAPKGMKFDQLLLIKINACHVRICVESKDSLADSDTLDGKMNRKSLVQTSEIRLKQK